MSDATSKSATKSTLVDSIILKSRDGIPHYLSDDPNTGCPGDINDKNVTNKPLLENLKAILAERTAARERCAEILHRLRIFVRSVTSMTVDQIGDRHSMDRLRERIERIEHRQELTD